MGFLELEYVFLHTGETAKDLFQRKDKGDLKFSPCACVKKNKGRCSRTGVRISFLCFHLRGIIQHLTMIMVYSWYSTTDSMATIDAIESASSASSSLIPSQASSPSIADMSPPNHPKVMCTPLTLASIRVTIWDLGKLVTDPTRCKAYWSHKSVSFALSCLLTHRHMMVIADMTLWARRQCTNILTQLDSERVNSILIVSGRWQ